MKILRDCFEIFVVYLLQIFIVIISSIICSLIGYDVNNVIYYVMLIFYILLVLFLIRKYKVNDSKIKLGYYFISCYFVLSVSVLLNMLFFLFGLQNTDVANMDIVLLIISSGIIGPIMEEYLFRNILLNRLLSRYSVIKAVLIESFIFAFFHGSLNGFIYAFFIGIILSFIYVNYKNIKIPILCHMVSNIFVLFLYEFNFYILLLSFACFFISTVIIYKNNVFGKNITIK